MIGVSNYYGRVTWVEYRMGGDMPVLSMIRYGIIGPLLRGTRALQAAQFSD